ncbi:hypothetical protein P3X46_002106 [Hevea brasiliensis]|uniref:AAA+ ATPase domain-containing protein n=1 Tax=Hevea brasiliensis TaxID=3981 RepID=A0ABQ9N1Y3_HEVBR|nr:hypothetical protein P3X46_002106 [Hevea brasiliensis]
MSTLPKIETVLSTAASAILFCSIARNLIPQAVEEYLHSTLQNISARFSSQLTVIIEEFEGLAVNQMFQAANLYLGSNLSPKTRRELAVTIDRDQELVDVFKGVKLKWVLISSHIEMPVASNKKRHDSALPRSELRCFELSFHEKYRDMEKKTLKLHTVDYNGTDYWGSINFHHPAKFDTIAMDPDMKNTLIEDLDRFIAGKEFYSRVGKAWKRGYLLYGPPGTGKSSLVAAMANYLKFDVYDLDLKEVQCNSDLRRLLIGTGNRSILVVEDIDRSFESVEDMSVEDNKVTLSGFLNFIDGLWSSCGDERIIVFTTNHRAQLDPVLLRPGRMDMQLHMSYCTFIGFKILASNYLHVQEHQLFEEIEHLLEKVQITPAEVAGELMKHKDADLALQELIKFLQNKLTSILL